ncbi:hypothetical protein NFI96_030589, partial [Prochilodus magdalenae]
VRNLGVKGLPVLVSFMMPSQIGNNFTLDKHNIIEPQNLKGCSSGQGSDSALCLNQTSCVKFECPSFCLEKESAVRFELKAQVTFLNPEKYTGRWPVGEFSLEKVLWSFAELDFDRNRYSQTSNGPKDDATKFHRAKASVKTELVIPPDMYMIVISGGAGGLLLLIIFFVLLWKCGFFKRKRPYEPCGEYEDEGQTDEKVNSDSNGKNGEPPSMSEDTLLPAKSSES